MDWNNKGGAGPTKNHALPAIRSRTRAHCFAEGAIPWMAGHIEWVPIDTIRLPTAVFRHHPKRQLRLLRKSITEYGFTTPLLVDHDLTLILGDARLTAARALGMDVVPVIRATHLTDRQVAALKLADNKIAELAKWDWDAVARELEACVEVCLDIEVTGFTVGESDLVIARNIPKVHADALDDCPPIDRSGPISQPGDMFILDEHRLVCGDSRDLKLVANLMNHKVAAASFCDAPYNVPISGNVSGLGKIKHVEFAMASGEMTDEEFADFLEEHITVLRSISDPGAVHYSCMDWRSIDILVWAIRRTGGHLLNICTWAKTNPGMGAFYRSQTEFIAVFKFGDDPHQNNVELGANGRNRSNLWTYEGANSINPKRRQELALHPTVKPAQMVADAILDCTTRGDVVFDGFLGSGTTLIAAEDTGRTCYGCEISPTYVDVAIRRWQEFTGGTAFHQESRLSFDQLATRRHRLLTSAGKAGL
jgi:DNA modification methylase